MSKYKLAFKLKQHTPIIHFQHEQYGATLRASELKPKLDKFLIEKFKEKDIDFSKWLINGQEKALDYKVRVDVVISDIEKRMIREGRNNQYGFFFGTIGEEYRRNPKGLTFTGGEIELHIHSFKTELLNEVEKNIVLYFERTNFGTRQNKGFGSFTIIKQIKNGKEIEVRFSNAGYKTYFSLALNNNNH